MNRFRLLGLFTLFIFLCTSSLFAQIVINEFSYDDAGSDDKEFIELYNTSSSPVDISGWMVRAGDQTFDNDYTIPASTTIAGNGYYVIGNTGVPNVDQVEAGGFVQNGDDWIQLINTSGVQQDFVYYEANKGNITSSGLPSDATSSPAFEGTGYWGNHTLQDSAGWALTPSVIKSVGYASFSVSRHSDGQDTDVNALDFGNRIATPGDTNSTGTIDMGGLPVTYTFDVADGTDLGDIMPGSYQNAIAQDPTVADTIGSYDLQNNPNSISASPQGGNILVAWDDTGGGNANIWNIDDAIQDIEVEAYVYLDGVQPTSDDGSWKTFFALRGCEDPFYHNLGSTNGAAGIIVRHIHDTWDGNKIQVLDKIGDVETLIGEIDIVSGVNDGWQRLLVSASGSGIAAVLGGTYGDPYTGKLFASGTTSIVQAGGIGAGFREYFTDDTQAEPIRMDNVTFRAPSLESSFYSFGTDVEYEISIGPKASNYDLADAVITRKVSSTDLINGQTGTVSAGGFHGATVGGVGDLSDGEWDANGTTVIASDAAYPSISLQVEYLLNDALTTGMVIFAGHDGDGARGFINCEVEIDQGSGYTALDTLETGPYGHPKPNNSLVSYVAKTYDPPLPGVEKMRFTFHSVSHNSTGFFQRWDDNTTNPPVNYPNQGIVLKEIDVFGTPAASGVEDWFLY